MINQVIDGVVAAISTAYGTCPIYTDNTQQGMTEPCFSVVCIDPKQKQRLGTQYVKECPVCVYYFPEPGAENTQINEVIETLFSILDVIPGDFRGTNMNAHVEDDVLAFRVDYNFFVRRVDPDNDKMNTLEMRESAYE